MKIDQTALNHIATSLSKHFDSLYYVDIETGEFKEFVASDMLSKLGIPKEGEDFFYLSQTNAYKCVHPDDLETVRKLHDKNTVLERLSKDNHYSIVCRLILDGKIIHVRHIFVMCEDEKHLLCCMENVESEFQEKAEQKRNLQSAERMAHRDELTGIKNKNAFTEYSQRLDNKIKAKKECHFALVMCDLNDLKHINDTRGHSFGDESLQRASRMICDIFKHSPVFRIGGDEFVAVLTEQDYESRDYLLKMLRVESAENGRTRSGPVVASGLSVYEPKQDESFCEVFERADREMYENKNVLKSRKVVEGFRKMDDINKVIPPERKRRLDGLFGALYTVAGEGYVYLNDMRYDYSRWSLPLIDDFAMESEYMYHADKVWLNYIHPDDIKVYNDAVDAVLCGNAELRKIFYRARKADGTYVLLTTRGFVLNDSDGNPEYFGGIMFSQ